MTPTAAHTTPARRLHLVEHATRVGGPAGLAALADTLRHPPAQHQHDTTATDTVVLIGGDPARHDAHLAGLNCRVEHGPYGKLGRVQPLTRTLLANGFDEVRAYDPGTAERLQQRRLRLPVHLLALRPTADTIDRTRLDRAASDVARLRSTLGGSKAMPLVGLVGDHPLYTDGFGVAMVLGLSCMAYHPAAPPIDARMLTHPRQHRRPLADRLSEGVGRPGRVVQHAAAAAPWLAYPACDALVADDPCALAWPWAEATGVPLIATPGPLANAALARGANVWTTPTNQPRHIAYVLGQVLRQKYYGVAVATA
ncbi:MAG: hypothetical protein AAF288_01805 [Planctomycetota bacterium]